MVSPLDKTKIIVEELKRFGFECCIEYDRFKSTISISTDRGNITFNIDHFKEMSIEECLREIKSSLIIGEIMKYKNQWKVPSSSSSNTYIVSETHAGEYECSCLAWTRQRKECKHIKGIRCDSAGVMHDTTPIRSKEKIDIMAGLKSNAKWTMA